MGGLLLDVQLAQVFVGDSSNTLALAAALSNLHRAAERVVLNRHEVGFEVGVGSVDDDDGTADL